MNNYSRIERHIREAQLQRSVEMAEMVANTLLWIGRGFSSLTAKVRGTPAAKAQPATAQN